MASSLVLHDINSIDEIFLAYVGYDSNYINGNVQLAHEGGLEMEIPNVDGVDSMSLKCTWRTCGNKYWLGNYIIAIQSHGHSLK
jgi:hypothetical protein